MLNIAIPIVNNKQISFETAKLVKKTKKPDDDLEVFAVYPDNFDDKILIGYVSKKSYNKKESLYFNLSRPTSRVLGQGACTLRFSADVMDATLENVKRAMENKGESYNYGNGEETVKITSGLVLNVCDGEFYPVEPKGMDNVWSELQFALYEGDDEIPTKVIGFEYYADI